MYNPLLRTFVIVADEGSFTRAQDKLFASATAIMKQINALEEHLQVKLFERTRRGVTLTEAGRSVYRDALHLFGYSRAALNRARALDPDSRRSIRVGTSMLNPCKVFVDLWHIVSDRLPGYTLRIVPFEDNREGILAQIDALGDRFDFLVGACDSSGWKKRSSCLVLGYYRMCCALPQDHRLAARSRLEVTDLAGETVLVGRRGDSPSVDRVRDELERHGDIAVEDVDQFYDIDVFNRCEQEKKILLSLECWSEVHPSLLTLPVNWQHKAPYGLVCPLRPSQPVRAVMDVVQELMRAGLCQN